MAGFASPLYDLDPRTGFMPPEPPLLRLPHPYGPWEVLLDDAKRHFVNPGPSGLATATEKQYTAKWRKRVITMPVLDCTEMGQDVRKVRRAHHVLAYLAQFYIHSMPPRAAHLTKDDPIVIPSPIAIPLISVSRTLGIAPIVTYADTVLWNWALKDPSLPLSRTNMTIPDLFTGSKQEEHFFLTSAKIEVRGWEALDAIDLCVQEAKMEEPDVESVTRDLIRLSGALDDITAILLAVRDGLDPDFFYNKFRPWIQGADQGEDSPSWHYEGVDGFGLTLQPSGPSAGQSALMHSFDAFLDVPHPHSKKGLGGGCTRFNSALDPNNKQLELVADTPAMCPVTGVSSVLPDGHPPIIIPPITPNSPNTRSTTTSSWKKILILPSHFPPTPPLTPPVSKLALDIDALSLDGDDVSLLPNSSSPGQIDTSFNARMRSYMTEAHQNYLTMLSANTIRPFIQARSSTHPELVQAYSACVTSLKKWRDAHIRIVTQFVIVPARAKGGANDPCAKGYSQRVCFGFDFDEKGRMIDLDGVEGRKVERLPVRGTGGTSLIPLLKRYRDNTLSRVIKWVGGGNGDGIAGHAP
ncbi:Indoleamine 2,3-dioxygenase [Cantharellus anzutake]|uniref:Indoleamine 2,3-dioxygenase n=1 Tax=Cantharellus anzutake TaxID=1750568 RepID=UPI0019075B74|nr:Indoleamine 2,3-dioxygenase [Cantharellus anzutake]KAF8327209.1 Indoleamine 2,3-dioxygenase [Cantharellus anzutake]